MKIYLAKSNRANPDHVIMVRKALQERPEIQIVEFQGGKYTNEPLMSCDALIVVPENTTPTENTIRIGKGLNDQIVNFNEKSPAIYMALFDTIKHDIAFFTIKAINHIEQDWQANWAECVLRYDLVDLFMICSALGKTWPDHRKIQNITDVGNPMDDHKGADDDFISPFHLL